MDFAFWREKNPRSLFLFTMHKEWKKTKNETSTIIDYYIITGVQM